VFERFTKQARAVVLAAIDEAREEGARAVEPEHLVLGVLRAAPNPGADALQAEGVDLEGLRAAAARLPGETLAAIGIDLDDVRAAQDGLGGPSPLPRPRRRARRLPFAPAGRRVLERALRIASGRRERHIGAEHVLLALLTARPGRARRLLAAAGADAGAVAARLASPAPR